MRNFFRYIGRWALRSPATFALHVALAVIVAGALITHFSGAEGEVTLAEGAAPAEEFMLDSGTRVPLPARLQLLECRVEYYPGTTAPCDYVSLLLADGDTVAVSMNHVLTISGHRFCQKSMGSESSTLSVSRDPAGVAVTYTGYALLLVSMILFFFQRRSGFRALLAASVAALCSLQASAVSPRVARGLDGLAVYWGDRVCPFGTMASDVITRVSGRSGWRGLSATEVAAGWVFDYDTWKHEPMIRIKGERLHRLLGVEGDYASLMDFYSPAGYKLEEALGDLSDRNIRDAHERVELLTGLLTGASLRFYPYRSALGRDEWLSWADRRPSRMDLDDWIQISSTASGLARGIALADDDAALSAIASIASGQRASGLLDEARMASERLYNNICGVLPVAIVALCLGLLLFLLLCLGRLGRRGALGARVACGALFIYAGLLLCLRWHASGHLPLSNGFETMLLMGWIAAAVGTFGRQGAAALTVGGLCLMVCAMNGNPGISLLMPVLGSPLLSVHVAVIMASYVLFALMVLGSAAALARPADREALRRRMLLMLYPAEFLLTAGIFIGAVWANQSWGRYWGWDPKETWALVTMLVYAVPLHWRSLPLFRRGRLLFVYLIGAFVSVLITYFGVNYFMSGLHSYAA